MDNFRSLQVWQKSIDLAVIIYKVTSKFPKEEMYGITSQMRRCSVSISSNIAEGAGRNSKQDFRRFLNIAYSSACELETQLIISNKLKYVTGKQNKMIFNLIEEIQKMLYGLTKTLKITETHDS
jgi:four helix bundle protein